MPSLRRRLDSIDALDDLVRGTKPVPLTDPVRLDKEMVYDLLEQIRASLPTEIQLARRIAEENPDALERARDKLAAPPERPPAPVDPLSPPSDIELETSDKLLARSTRSWTCSITPSASRSPTSAGSTSSFYELINQARDEIPMAVKAARRVLREHRDGNLATRPGAPADETSYWQWRGSGDLAADSTGRRTATPSLAADVQKLAWRRRPRRRASFRRGTNRLLSRSRSPRTPAANAWPP